MVTQPLSKQAETEFMKNVTKVLMLASSKKGTLLRQSFANLRRLYIESHWNAKYLKILEKPFQTLSEGAMETILVVSILFSFLFPFIFLLFFSKRVWYMCSLAHISISLFLFPLSPLFNVLSPPGYSWHGTNTPYDMCQQSFLYIC